VADIVPEVNERAENTPFPKAMVAHEDETGIVPKTQFTPSEETAVFVAGEATATKTPLP